MERKKAGQGGWEVLRRGDWDIIQFDKNLIALTEKSIS